jgi:hypothetical protein
MTERPKMNQRFVELKKQAHEYAVDQEWYIDSFEQKFAELIVAECLDNCMAANDRDRIREHFGVEL